MTIYLTLLSGVIWTLLLLFQPVHGYNGLTLTSNTPFVLATKIGQEPYDNEVLKAVLDGLPLLRTKGILFVEANFGGCMASGREKVTVTETQLPVSSLRVMVLTKD
jgi:hypothetical protein